MDSESFALELISFWFQSSVILNTIGAEAYRVRLTRLLEHHALPPLHRDNESIFKERIYLDKTDPNLLHDEITIIDHALTRPWIVDKKYIRTVDTRPTWPEFNCNETNAEVKIGGEYMFKERYMTLWDGEQLKNFPGHGARVGHKRPPELVVKR